MFPSCQKSPLNLFSRFIVFNLSFYWAAPILTVVSKEYVAVMKWLKRVEGAVDKERVWKGQLALEGSMGLQQNVEGLFAVIWLTSNPLSPRKPGAPTALLQSCQECWPSLGLGYFCCLSPVLSSPGSLSHWDLSFFFPPSAAFTQPVFTRLVLSCRSFCSSSRVFAVWLLSSLWEEMLWRGSERVWGEGGRRKRVRREKKGISHPVRGEKWATPKRPRREPEGKTEQPARVGTGAVGRELKWRNVSVCTLAQAVATRPRRYWKETRRSSKETMMWPRSFVCSLLRYCWLHRSQLFSMSSQGHLVHDQSLRWSVAPLCSYLSLLPTPSHGPPRAPPCSFLSSVPVELLMVTPMRMMPHHRAILLQDLPLPILNRWLKQMFRGIHLRHTTAQMRSTHRLF